MNTIKINPADNVAVALRPMSAGERVEAGGAQVTLLEDVMLGHKIALASIPAGQAVIKYGCPIGYASIDIKPGCHVHSHNLKTGLSGQVDYVYSPTHQDQPTVPPPHQDQSTAPPPSASPSPSQPDHSTAPLPAPPPPAMASLPTATPPQPDQSTAPLPASPLLPQANISLPTATPSQQARGSFMGFKRRGGKVGIRNEIWIVPTVGCVNSIGEAVARKAQSLLRGSVQGVYSFSHPYGCSQLGEDHENTKKALCGLIRHPNVGGVLVLSLGCENNGVRGMREMLLGACDSNGNSVVDNDGLASGNSVADNDGLASGNSVVDETRVRFLVCQDYEDEIAAALKLVEELVAVAEGDAREPVPVSELVVGLKCGGSDGLSGITANPLVGAFSDRLISEGGSAILTEVPEMFGAETILMNRCKSLAIFDKAVDLINGFKEYYIRHGQTVYENPSPGNKEGGITTLEDKSLGCIQKAGSATVSDVLSYGEALHEKGLNLLESPGNDLVASTALAASGVHLILFTTGRGTPFGSPAPTVKISSNTRLFEKKRGWIDFDAGPIVDGADITEMADSLYSYVLRLASGTEYTKTERNGIRDIAIFKGGVTL